MPHQRSSLRLMDVLQQMEKKKLNVFHSVSISPPKVFQQDKSKKEEKERNFPIEIIFVNLPTAVTTRSQGKHFQNMVKRGCRWVILEVKGVDQKVREQVRGNGKCGLEFTRRCPTHLDGLGPQKAKRKEAETSFTSYYD
ncbi:hypothetical protein TNIN_261811 [Trichonephila inaurata madagascariensis]|uniref:Uncharacterized protein n=1 Tax=Trichonephila inaurata madagascariensis TaxID=2747483 RepID=A0A8X6YHE6_9ARAC|nr:hypothetical protein TNIN_261811 [Trichonephila inaurata madagascariensis]